MNNQANSIHEVLKKLIEAKSKRDNIRFTNAQLAAALSMPRSMIAKLTHDDELKRVLNPRVDTLLKIVNFFRSDGFDITIDELLGLKLKNIEISNQALPNKLLVKRIDLFSFNGNLNKKLGMISIKTKSLSDNIIALYAEEDIKPFFKTGSIFIIDKNQIPQDDTLVAAILLNETTAKVMKYYINGNNVFLQSMDQNKNIMPIKLDNTVNLIGTIIQINAKT